MTVILPEVELTIEIARNSDQLSLLKKNDKPLLLGVIIKLLSEIQTFLKCELSTQEKVIYANMLVSEFWHFKIDDIILCFRQGINGHYGHIYGKFNYETLTDWLNSYEQSKLNHVDNEHAALKETNQTSQKPYSGHIGDIIKENKLLKSKLKRRN